MIKFPNLSDAHILFTYLLDFSCGAFEEFDVTCADTLSVLGKCFVCFSIIGEENKGVSCGSTISLVNK